MDLFGKQARQELEQLQKTKRELDLRYSGIVAKHSAVCEELRESKELVATINTTNKSKAQHQAEKIDYDQKVEEYYRLRKEVDSNEDNLLTQHEKRKVLLTKDMRELETKVSSLRGELVESQQRIKALEKEIQAGENKRDSARAEFDKLKSSKADVETALKKSQEKQSELTGAVDIRERADESRRNLTSLYGGVHIDPPEPGVIEGRIANDSAAWLANAEQQWGSFYNDMMVYTANYLAAIDRELASGLVADAGGGTLLELSLSPVRVEVQTNVREQTEYIDEYQVKKKQKSGGMSGLGIGLMLGGLILGGWLGAGLAIFGGASLFGKSKSWDDDEEMEKIRKPVTKQIKEFSLTSLESPYHRLTTEMLTHLDKVLQNALKGLLTQVETIAKGHHEKLRKQITDIEQKRSGAESSQEILRLQAVLGKVETLSAGLTG